MSETMVERRLREMARWVARDPGALPAHGVPQDASAIDAGREAIALWSRYMDAITPVQCTAIYHEASALLARCEPPA